jgi:hypothetical protein
MVKLSFTDVIRKFSDAELGGLRDAIDAWLKLNSKAAHTGTGKNRKGTNESSEAQSAGTTARHKEARELLGAGLIPKANLKERAKFLSTDKGK